MVMGIKPPARGSVLLLEVFRKRAFLNTLSKPPSPALTKCSTTMCNNTQPFNNAVKGLLNSFGRSSRSRTE